MSIEALQRAAMAAGYAMAAPDDDQATVAPAQSPSGTQRRDLVAVGAATPARKAGEGAPPVFSDWVRGYLPVAFGGRATA